MTIEGKLIIAGGLALIGFIGLHWWFHAELRLLKREIGILRIQVANAIRGRQVAKPTGWRDDDLLTKFDWRKPDAR